MSGRRPNLNEQLVTSSEAALLLGVERSVVSNYKRRHKDFPVPAFADSTGRVTLYWKDEIEAWGSSRLAGAVESALAKAEMLEQCAQKMREAAARLRGTAP